MKKQTKTLALINALTGLVQKIQERSLRLAEEAARLGQGLGVTQLSVQSLEKRVEDNERGRVYTQSTVRDLENHTSQGFERVEVDVKNLRANADRAWSLAESRNSIYRKAVEDLTTTLQRFNQRLSAIEGEPKAAAAFQHLTGMNGRLEVLEGKTGMLGECIGAHNSRITMLENLTITYSTPYLLEDGNTLVIISTEPDGRGKRISAKVYSPAEYREHVEKMTALMAAQAQGIAIGVESIGGGRPGLTKGFDPTGTIPGSLKPL